jgi:hypothetical protein
MTTTKRSEPPKAKTLHDYDRENQRHVQQLQDLSSNDQNAHRRLYKNAIREKAGEVQIPDEVLAKMADLEDKLLEQAGRSKTAGDHFCYARQTGLSFIEAYLTARFGEDTRVWPEPIDWEAEKTRLDRWYEGKSPAPATFRIED